MQPIVYWAQGNRRFALTGQGLRRTAPAGVTDWRVRSTGLLTYCLSFQVVVQFDYPLTDV